jgi:uncharacterized protein YcbK (DUF882 family)
MGVNFTVYLEEEKGHMNSEINMLEQQLQDEQESSDQKSNRITKIEKDIRDLRVQLEQKIEMGKYRGVMVIKIKYQNICIKL